VEYILGQRYICDAEPELGLGQIIEVGHRTLTLVFAATETTRQYAMANAPLSRVTFEPGDTITDKQQQSLTIISTQERDGLMLYTTAVTGGAGTETRLLPETELSSHLSLSQPLKRLLALQTESSNWYQLRRQALQCLSRIESSPLLGLCSARTDLLPHQIYIAHEVASRPAPRVLLSDEVGLGKTIEAGLILQQQLFSGLASRVLVMVPDSLVHQWLVELLRRFNLRFTILDQERCEALTEVHDDNPFESEQLVLCSKQFLLGSPRWKEAALQTGWDLLILDEAHHLLPQTDIHDHSELQAITPFTTSIPGVLLLTATPDQLGAASYFHLLRLLDQSRFHCLEDFQAEQEKYHQLATLLDPLLQYAKLSNTGQTNLLAALGTFARDPDLQQLLADLEQASETNLQVASRKLLNALLDRHGTGRIVFRNTRKQVAGFPQRQLEAHLLPLPAAYEELANHLQPELAFIDNDNWLKDDPRVSWIYELIRTHRQEKFLLICASRPVAESLEAYLRLHKGLRTAVFHEGLSLVERDRAAAYFAETDFGAQLLVCSEIGSEGRNFQFSRHLVLFDLPRNPDLLEQRIGRLDRIGQVHDIQLYVPCFANSAQQVLLALYDQALGIFTQPNPVAAQVTLQLTGEIDACLHDPGNHVALDVLVTRARKINHSLLERHSLGRDRLLELNSCRPEAAAALIAAITEQETHDTPAGFLQAVFASYGLDAEVNSNLTTTVKPNDDMLVESFPLIPDDGMTYTLDRSLALSRDDLPFVNWLHPLLLQSLDLVLQDNHGKCTVGVLRDKRLPTGTLVMESLYRVTVPAPPALQGKRWFPLTTLRTVIDSQKRSIGASLTPEQLDTRSDGLDKQHVRTLVTDRKQLIQLLARLGQQVAEKQLPGLITDNTRRMQGELADELQRLTALASINPQVKPAELEFLKTQRSALEACYAKARLHLEAIRLLICL